METLFQVAGELVMKLRWRDEAQDETQLSFLLSLYSYRTVGGRREHTLFYFLRF